MRGASSGRETDEKCMYNLSQKTWKGGKYLEDLGKNGRKH